LLFLTARAGSEARIESLDAGADDYLTKPFDEGELLVRIRGLLRVRAQERELVELNRALETRVEQQVAEIERMRRLKRFFSPQLAELMLSTGREHLLESHRREVTVVFCDLRGFTAFSETAEPEEVMGVLGEYHALLGHLIFQFEGTIERFAGDGLMVFFNDPLPCPDPAVRAVRMAVAMRRQMVELTERWRKRGNELGFGVGVAQGYATLGMIGFDSRVDYGAIGPVTNLASRLCGEAQDGQILVSQRVLAAVESLVEIQAVGELILKGFLRAVPAWNIVRLQNE
jgi:class 3 adenylate cyclase